MLDEMLGWEGAPAAQARRRHHRFDQRERDLVSVQRRLFSPAERAKRGRPARRRHSAGKNKNVWFSGQPGVCRSRAKFDCLPRTKPDGASSTLSTRANSAAPELVRRLAGLPEIQLTVTVGRNAGLKVSVEKIRRTVTPGIRDRRTGATSCRACCAPIISSSAKPAARRCRKRCRPRCPMIVNHVIPGQEEGNARFILETNSGTVAPTPRCRDRRGAKCVCERRRAMARMVHEHQPARPADRVARYREVSCFRCNCRDASAKASQTAYSGAADDSRTLASNVLPVENSARPRRTFAAPPAPARAQRNPHRARFESAFRSMLRSARAGFVLAIATASCKRNAHLHAPSCARDRSCARRSRPARNDRPASRRPPLTMQSAPARVKTARRPAIPRPPSHRSPGKCPSSPSRDKASSSGSAKRDDHPRSART